MIDVANVWWSVSLFFFQHKVIDVFKNVLDAGPKLSFWLFRLLVRLEKYRQANPFLFYHSLLKGDPNFVLTRLVKITFSLVLDLTGYLYPPTTTGGVLLHLYVP